MNETKPANIVVRLLKSDNWTEEGGIRAVTTWLRLPTAHKDRIDLIMGQSDLLALGARDKLIMQSNMGNTLFAGVDGLLDGGQKWVQKGSLTATIIVPTTAGIAIEQMANALRGGIEAPEMTFTVPVSYPSIEALRKNASSHQLAHAVGRK